MHRLIFENFGMFLFAFSMVYLLFSLMILSFGFLPRISWKKRSSPPTQRSRWSFNRQTSSRSSQKECPKSMPPCTADINFLLAAIQDLGFTHCQLVMYMWETFLTLSSPFCARMCSTLVDNYSRIDSRRVKRTSWKAIIGQVEVTKQRQIMLSHNSPLFFVLFSLSPFLPYRA